MHLKIQRKKEVHKNNLQSIGNSLSSGKEKLGQLFDRIYDVIHRKDAYEQWQRGCIQALEEQNRELALMNQEKEVNADTENKQVKIKK